MNKISEKFTSIPHANNNRTHSHMIAQKSSHSTNPNELHAIELRYTFLFSINLYLYSKIISWIEKKNQNSTDIEAPLILPCWFPFNNYWNKFWIIFGIEYYIMNVGMLIVPCWHSFIVSMMGYVIINLKILNYKLSSMREFDNKKIRNVELIKCVDHREKLVCFISELSSLISSSLFLDFIIFSLLLCMLLFQASQVCMLVCWKFISYPWL